MKPVEFTIALFGQPQKGKPRIFQRTPGVWCAEVPPDDTCPFSDSFTCESWRDCVAVVERCLKDRLYAISA